MLPIASSDLAARARSDRAVTGLLDPLGRRTLIGLHLFNAISAVGGGIALAAGLLFVPVDLLRHTPFDSFVVPGIFLAVIIGGSATIAATALLKHRPRALIANAAAGVVMVGWILGETLLVEGFSWLQGLYLLTGSLAVVATIRLFWAGKPASESWAVAPPSNDQAGPQAQQLVLKPKRPDAARLAFKVSASNGGRWETPRRSVREAAVFFALTLGLSYLVFWGPLALLQVETISFVTKGVGPPWAVALFVLGLFVPSLIGLALTSAYEGRAGLRRLGKGLVAFRIGWRWYLAAVAAVTAIAVCQIAINRVLGYEFDFGLYVVQFGSFIPLIILGPLSEEIGWRGFVLDRLQTRYNPLISSLIVGVFWALWHLPLFYMVGTSHNVWGTPFPGFAVGVMGLSVLFTWLHNNTSGSVWTAVFFHWICTCSAQVIATGVHRTATYSWLEYLPHVVVAAVVVVLWGPQFFSRDERVSKQGGL